MKTIEKETVKTDDGEIEVTQNKVHEENENDEVKKEGIDEVDEGEEEHEDEREPSPGL